MRIKTEANEGITGILLLASAVYNLHCRYSLWSNMRMFESLKIIDGEKDHYNCDFLPLSLEG